MAALVQCAIGIGEGQVEEILGLLQRMDLPGRRYRHWVGIEFEDGYDCFFIRVRRGDAKEPNEIIAEKIASEFHHINAIRSAVLIGLRWFALEHDIAIEQNLTGVWPIQTSGGASSSSVQVGPRLTRIAQESSTAAEAFLKFRHNQWLPELTIESGSIGSAQGSSGKGSSLEVG